MRRISMLKRIGMPLLVVVAMLGLATAVSAHKKTYSTTVTATAPNKNHVTGKVLSGNPKCIPNRAVTVYSPAGVLEGSATTDSLGNFETAPKNMATGTHVVKVNRRVIRKTRHHTHKCGYTQSTFIVS
jgi:hypothetical protein